MSRRLIVLGLDGFEISLAEAMMASGEMPHMARLAETASVFDLDHGRAKATGLAWEQVATGRGPGDGGRWSALTFDPERYTVRQAVTSAQPVFADLADRMVVFDAPYFDLARSGARGVTNWGAHDPGVSAQASPAGLDGEILARFGRYAARRWIYGFTWPSADRTAEAGADLIEGVRQRSRVAAWLLGERLTDWDVALVTVSEAHSAIEQFWHGVDPAHPLHGIPSAHPAGEALRGIYREIDAMCGTLREVAPDAGIVVFAMHGMGTNQADIPSMVLLPELMFRLAFGRSHAGPPAWRQTLPGGVPLMEPHEDWFKVMQGLVPSPAYQALRRSLSRAWRRLRLSRWTGYGNGGSGTVDWMPSARYQPYWPRMPAFAFPSFYDGQIRINLAGREKRGVVPVARFDAARDELVAALHDTRCLHTGEPVVDEIWYPESAPLERGPSEADIYIEWRGTPLGFEHPVGGRIGPYPFRRTGGHTGERGFAYIDWPGLARDRERRSAFDIVPTIFELLGERIPGGLAGTPIRPGSRR